MNDEVWQQGYLSVRSTLKYDICILTDLLLCHVIISRKYGISYLVYFSIRRIVKTSDRRALNEYREIMLTLIKCYVDIIYNLFCLFLQ